MNLIDHYGRFKSIKQQQKRIFDQRIDVNDEDAALILLKLLQVRIIKHYPNDYISIIDSNQYQNKGISTTQHILQFLSHQIYLKQYQFYIQVNFNPQLCQISIRATFIKNGLFIRLHTKQRMLMVLRLIQNINLKINPVILSLDYFSGEICLQHSSFVDNNLGKHKFKKNMYTMTHRIQFLIQMMIKYKILLLFCLDGQIQKLKEASLSFFAQGELQMINQKLQTVQTNLSEINFKTYDKHYKIDTITRKKYLNYYATQFNQTTQQIIDLYIGSINIKVPPLQQLSNQNYDKNYLKSLLTIKQETFSTKINLKVQFIEKSQMVRQDSGGHGIIFSTMAKFKIIDNYYISYIYGRQYNEGYQYKIAIKMDKKATHKFASKRSNARIPRQKHIIDYIGHYEHPNISTFLKDDKFDENCIYSLWEDNSSLKNYMQRVKCLSFFQLLVMMQQSAKALYFLHKHNVTHLDFKPGNIIIGKKHLVKLTDFGSSFINSQDPDYHKLSYTYPYAPPQICHKFKTWSKDIKILPQADIYSLGVTIYECFFGQYGWSTQFEEMKEKKRSFSAYSLRIAVQKFKDAGEQRVAKILAYLSLRCIEDSPENRPKLPWIITILENCRQYLGALLYR